MELGVGTWGLMCSVLLALTDVHSDLFWGHELNFPLH